MSIQDIFGKSITHLSSAIRNALRMGFIADEHPSRLSCDDAGIDRLVVTYRTALDKHCVGVALRDIEVINNTHTTCSISVNIRVPYGIKEEPLMRAHPISSECDRSNGPYNEYGYTYKVRPGERFMIDTSDILLFDAGDRVCIVQPNIPGLLINIRSLDTSTMPEVTGKKRLLDRSVALVPATVMQ